MKIVFFALLVVILLGVIIFIIGLCLPQIRIVSKETVYNSPIEKVYHTVVNNYDWQYRTSLDDLKILEHREGFEVWDEISSGNTIRFRTKEKRPCSFYSFEMESRFFSGYWFAEFDTAEGGNTRFKATESIQYRNPFIRVFAYAFMDLDKYMKTYQVELKNKLEE